MEENSRRQFLGKTLQGIVISLLALVPGSFFNTRKALAQVQKVAPKPLAVSATTTTTLKSVLPKTTAENVIEVLQTTKLVQEDQLAELAVRQLSGNEILQSLKEMKKISAAL